MTGTRSPGRRSRRCGTIRWSRSGRIRCPTPGSPPCRTTRRRAEIGGSGDRVRERLGVPCRHFAFPYGRRGDCGPAGVRTRPFRRVRHRRHHPQGPDAPRAAAARPAALHLEWRAPPPGARGGAPDGAHGPRRPGDRRCLRSCASSRFAHTAVSRAAGRMRYHPLAADSGLDVHLVVPRRWHQFRPLDRRRSGARAGRHAPHAADPAAAGRAGGVVSAPLPRPRCRGPGRPAAGAPSLGGAVERRRPAGRAARRGCGAGAGGRPEHPEAPAATVRAHPGATCSGARR